MSILADVGVSNDQATAAIIGVVVTAAFNSVKNSLLSPGAIKQIEKENVMRDAKLDKLFEKTDRFEKYLAIAEDRAKRDE
jgi:hypothetical protein